MLKLTNLTNRDIEISKNLILKAFSYLEMNGNISKKMQQLQSMNLIKIQENTNEQLNYNTKLMSGNRLKRKDIIAKIKQGYTTPGVVLNHINTKEIKNNKETDNEKTVNTQNKKPMKKRK